MSRDAPARERPWWRHPLAAFALVVMAYACVALAQITLPGVYMDAVNPDYLVVKVLNRHAQEIGAWLLPANYLAGHRLPVLIAMYHGSLTFWAGLPFFWLFGTDVTGLRLTHAMFGIAVLSGAFLYLWRARTSSWLIALGCVALALDPSFSYAFRTQSHITLGSAAWMLWGAAALLHASDPMTRHRARWRVAAGLLFGVSIFGYFIHAFFFPALAWFAFTRSGATFRARMRGLVTWGAGLAVGLSGYWLGYGLIVREFHGVRGFLAFANEQQATLNAFKSAPSLGERAGHAWSMTRAILDNGWHHMLMFSEPAAVPGASLKIGLLVALPIALFILASARQRASDALKLVVALVVSFLVVSLVFGTRLGGHHYVVLLPLFYVALVLGVRDEGRAVAARGLAWLPALPFVVLAGLNMAGQVHEGEALARTRGVGLYSDAINRLAADLDRDPRKPFMYFPDWGLSMPVAFLTRGRIGMDSVENYDAARHRLCHGQNVGVALLGQDRDARFTRWQEELRWAPPVRAAYAQADGQVLFELGVFMADSTAAACAGK